MQYPLIEKIGDPNLLVGREKEFQYFNKWVANIPKKLSKSRLIIARWKSGKTAFVQRIFNQLWSANGAVIPFYFDFGESKMWYPNLAIKYYQAFASQYISFIERQAHLVNKPLSLQEIKDYGIKKSIKALVDDVDSLLMEMERGSFDLMWNIASEAPHSYAAIFDTKFLVILDEFQNINKYIYPDKYYNSAPIELIGSYNSLSESKLAPMLVSSSNEGWLLKVINKYLETTRFRQIDFSPSLTADEGLKTVYKYAEFYDEPITDDTAKQINQLCNNDPFLISCVIISDYKDKDLTNSENVIDTINYEMSERMKFHEKREKCAY